MESVSAPCHLYCQSQPYFPQEATLSEMRDASILLERTVNPVAVDVPEIFCSAGESRESVVLVLRPWNLCSMPCVTPPSRGVLGSILGVLGRKSCPLTRFNSGSELSQMLALGICLHLNSLSFISEILHFREES